MNSTSGSLAARTREPRKTVAASGRLLECGTDALVASGARQGGCGERGSSHVRTPCRASRARARKVQRVDGHGSTTSTQTCCAAAPESHMGGGTGSSSAALFAAAGAAGGARGSAAGAAAAGTTAAPALPPPGLPAGPVHVRWRLPGGCPAPPRAAAVAAGAAAAAVAAGAAAAAVVAAAGWAGGGAALGWQRALPGGGSLGSKGTGWTGRRAEARPCRAKGESQHSVSDVSSLSGHSRVMRIQPSESGRAAALL
jgi:hypothetical protein